MKPRPSLCAFALLGSALSAAEMIYQNDFETGDLAGLVKSGNAPSVATAPVASGKYAGNFDLTRAMATPYRTEVTAGAKGIFEWSAEYWIGFSFRLEQWADDQDMEIAPFQIHTTPADWNDNKPHSQISTGPVMMAVQNGEMRVYTYGGKIGWRAPVAPGRWIRMTLRFIPSFHDNGLIELWKDGEKIVSVAGANTWEFDHNGKPMRPMYWKMGVYKWNWKEGRPATGSTRRQLFIDDFKIAKGADGMALVGPPVATTAKDATLYAANFAQGAGGWQVLSGDFQAENGGYRSQALTNETKLSRALIGDQTWRDYSVRTRVKLEKATAPNSDYGIIARYQDPNNYYMFLYKIGPKKIVIERKLKGKLVDIAEAPVELAAGETHEIRGTLSGATLQVEVDGRKLAEVTDENFASGGAGALAYWADVRFESFSVHGADGGASK